MNDPRLNMAQKVAQAASTHQKRRTGHAPTEVTVVLSDETLVVTLHNALTPAEIALSQTTAGAAQVQEFHRHLFATSVDVLREEIAKITGVPVREAALEIETMTGTIVHAFTSGCMVQVFLLAHGISEEDWIEVLPDGGPSHNSNHDRSTH